MQCRYHNEIHAWRMVRSFVKKENNNDWFNNAAAARSGLVCIGAIDQGKQILFKDEVCDRSSYLSLPPFPQSIPCEIIGSLWRETTDRLIVAHTCNVEVFTLFLPEPAANLSFE